MAEDTQRGEHQKQKLLYLAKPFTKGTDAQYVLSMAEITGRLIDCGASADRKVLYLDFMELQSFDMDIETVKAGRNALYRFSSRRFGLPELKFPVGSVQLAKFITDRESKELIAKLESPVNRYEAVQLQCQVIISDHIRTVNTDVYYNVDAIHETIDASYRIRFKYFQWNLEKEMKLRRNGAWYQISPQALVWDSGYCCLVACEAGGDKIKHYRVDEIK